MIRTICDGGINWNWYLCADYDTEKKTCHIFYYERWHKYEDRGSKHPKHERASGYIRILEEKETRIVYGVRLDDVEYLVTNPAYIFDYKDFSVYTPEVENL